uniref:WH2 domain-containing protein n=1 Tax=Syphacia muris TaxID=451379 RepID=A0A0N5ARQ3_9BILA
MSLIKSNKERKTDNDVKGRISNLVADPATSIHKSAHEIKESIKRPLTGLLRRPMSRGKIKINKDESMLPDVSTLEKVHSMGKMPALPVRIDAVNPKDAWMSKMDDIG